MGGARSCGHTNKPLGTKAPSVLYAAIAVAILIAVSLIVVYAIFHIYSDKLSAEFRDMASGTMNDYTVAQNMEAESLIGEVDSTVSILRVTMLMALFLIIISVAACIVTVLLINRLRGHARRNAERYAVLAEFSDTVLCEYFYQHDTLELTPNARGMFRLSALTSVGYVDKQVPLIDFLDDGNRRVRRMLEKPAPSNEMRTITCRARVPSGENRWFSITFRYLYEKKQPYRAVGKIVDITRQRKTEEVLTQKSQIDGLTKVLNKVTFEDRIATILREKSKGLLFVLDIDRFKQINDEYGHSRGDRVLEGVAKALLDVFRRRDPVGRIGGDEFVAFLEGTHDGAVVEAKRATLNSLVAELSCSLQVTLAISIGVARHPQDGSTYQELFDAADRAMYKEKNEGRRYSI